MSKFTPGPWSVVDDHPARSCLRIANSNKQELATIYHAPGEFVDVRNRCDFVRAANSHLIAAAPDMYDALEFGAQMALHEMSIGDMADALREWHSVAKMALSKAGGKS